MIKFNHKIKSGQGVKYFITSDLHFGHKNILKYNPNTRPFTSVEEMDNALIAHWNSKVTNNDVVFHLGDMFFCNKGRIEEILSQLNGHVVHLYGNHSKALRNQFNDLNAFDYLEIKYDKWSIVMNHYAQRVWNRAHYGSLHAFGHSHGSLEGVGRSVDVGWDNHGKILTIEEFIDMVSSKEIYCEDGHS